jgi:hypothetical protein
MARNKSNVTLATVESMTPKTPKDIAVQMRESGKTTSDIIRALAAIHVKDGEPIRGDIVKTLKDAGIQTKNGTDVKYQHVRNTLLLPIKKQPIVPQISANNESEESNDTQEMTE